MVGTFSHTGLVSAGRYSLLEAQAQEDGLKVYLPEEDGSRAALGIPASMDRLASREGPVHCIEA